MYGLGMSIGTYEDVMYARLIFVWIFFVEFLTYLMISLMINSQLKHNWRFQWIPRRHP